MPHPGQQASLTPGHRVTSEMPPAPHSLILWFQHICEGPPARSPAPMGTGPCVRPLELGVRGEEGPLALWCARSVAPGRSKAQRLSTA